jgi:DNA-binding IscR family transcriptional regulator
MVLFDVAIWDDLWFASLSVNAKLLVIYMMTKPTDLPPVEEISSVLGIAPAEAQAAFDAVRQAGLLISEEGGR